MGPYQVARLGANGAPGGPPPTSAYGLVGGVTTEKFANLFLRRVPAFSQDVSTFLSA